MVIDNVREGIIDLLDDQGITIEEAISGMVGAIWELAEREADPQRWIDEAVDLLMGEEK